MLSCKKLGGEGWRTTLKFNIITKHNTTTRWGRKHSANLENFIFHNFLILCSASKAPEVSSATLSLEPYEHRLCCVVWRRWTLKLRKIRCNKNRFEKSERWGQKWIGWWEILQMELLLKQGEWRLLCGLLELFRVCEISNAFFLA